MCTTLYAKKTKALFAFVSFLHFRAQSFVATQQSQDAVVNIRGHTGPAVDRLRELEFTINIPNRGREIIIPKCDRQQRYESRNSSFVQSAGLFLLLLLDVLLRR